MNFALTLLMIIQQLSTCINPATRREIGNMRKCNTGFMISADLTRNVKGSREMRKKRGDKFSSHSSYNRTAIDSL